MGLLDFFGRSTDLGDFAPSPTPPEEPKGGSGRWHTDGFLDLDEINSQLQGRAGLEKFQEMWRSDPDCRRILTMCMVPIVGANWRIDPYCDKDEEPTEQDLERAAFVEWNLMERMRPRWGAHLWVALTVAGRDGFGPFEQLYARDTWNGRQVFALDTLDLRLPRSVDRWVQDGHRLAGIEQHDTGRVVSKWSRAKIPAADLVYYRFGPEGDNWEGQSLLRPAFKNWKYKDALELIDTIGHERTHIGVPTGWAPADADAASLDAFEEFLASVRASDSGYCLIPAAYNAGEGQQWHWEFVTPNSTESGAKALLESLQYHRSSIDAAILAEFMRLGQQGEGARATADVQQNPFWQMVEALAGIVVEDPINEQLIPRMLGFNYDTADGRLPRLKCSLIDSTSLEGLAAYVGGLVREGAIRVEPRLEAYLRERADLPPADEDAIAEREEKAAEIAQQQAAAKPQPAPDKDDDDGKTLDAPITLARQDRDLRPFEQTMSLDRIESAIDQARDRLQAAAGEEARDLARTLAQQATTGKRIKPAPAPEALARAISGELLDLYATGRATVTEELERQALGLGTTPSLLATDDLPEQDAEQLDTMAQDAADAIRATIATALARARVVQNGPMPAVTALVDAERAAASALRTTAQDYAAGALNLGRYREADDRSDEIQGTYYTSILDGNRCTDCRVADDDVLRSLDDPVRMERVPPNRACNGGPRCRCLEAFIYRSEVPSER